MSLLKTQTSPTSPTTTASPSPQMEPPQEQPQSKLSSLAGVWVDEDRYKAGLDPLPPVNQYDKRPAVRDLLEQHKDKIKLLQTNLKDDPLYDPIKHDELWMVRYILSHKNIDKATKAAKEFIKYRKDRRLDEIDIRNDPPSLTCNNPHVRKYFQCNAPDAMIFCHPDVNRGVVLFLTLAGLDQNKMAQITDEEWPFWYFLEWMFQVLDSTTRRTGRLTKGIRLVDLKGFSLSQNNRECINRNAKNARECQDHYPQMLASVYVFHVIPIFQAAYRLIRPLLPKRFAEKLNIINPMKKEKDRLVLWPHIDEDHLPVKFGGKFQEWPYPMNTTCSTKTTTTMKPTNHDDDDDDDKDDETALTTTTSTTE